MEKYAILILYNYRYGYLYPFLNFFQKVVALMRIRSYKWMKSEFSVFSFQKKEIEQ